MIAKISPRLMLRETLSTATTALGPLPKTLETPSRTTMGKVLSPKLCASSLINMYP